MPILESWTGADVVASLLQVAITRRSWNGEIYISTFRTKDPQAGLLIPDHITFLKANAAPHSNLLSRSERCFLVGSRKPVGIYPSAQTVLDLPSLLLHESFHQSASSLCVLSSPKPLSFPLFPLPSL